MGGEGGEGGGDWGRTTLRQYQDVLVSPLSLRRVIHESNMYKDEGGVVHSDGSLRVDDSGGMDIEVASAGYLSIRKPLSGGF